MEASRVSVAQLRAQDVSRISAGWGLCFWAAGSKDLPFY